MTNRIITLKNRNIMLATLYDLMQAIFGMIILGVSVVFIIAAIQTIFGKDDE